MRRLMVTCLGGAWLMAAVGLAQAAEPGQWRQLFNGKNLDGWETWLGKPHPSVKLDLKKNEKGQYVEPVGLNNDPTKVYTVVEVDGAPAIRISGEIWGAITTTEEFENYHLRLKTKWGQKKWPPRENTVRDSGLLYHCIGPHGAGSGFWMKSFECQIQENDNGDFYSVAGVIVDVHGEQSGERSPLVFDPKAEKKVGWTRRIVRNPRSENESGQWNTVEIYVVGQTAVHVCNGKPNLVLTGLRHKVDGKEAPLTKGKIQIQSESAEVFYRDIEIRPITEIPKELLLGIEAD